MYVQLRRPSDKECSEPRPFQFLPTDSGSQEAGEGRWFGVGDLLTNKRFKPDFELYTRILAMDAAVLARRMFRAADDEKTLNNAAVQCDDQSLDQVPISAPAKPPPVPVKAQESESGAPPPLPEKGSGFAKLKGNLIKPGEGPVSRGAGKTVNFDRSSMATVVSESESDARYSVASSEDLNSRLSAAFSDYSDLTDVRSVAESEQDVNDVLSMVSSTHTLNDRLSLVSNASYLSDSGQTVIEQDGGDGAGARSETDSIDTIEKQLEMLESMSVEPDCQTYSSFQMAMRHPIWPDRPPLEPAAKPVTTTDIEIDHQPVNDLVYDDPDNLDDEILMEEVDSPSVPPRVESKGVLSTPPLPPRRFKKLNQPLPEPPVKDGGLKSALQALKQTFKKSKPIVASSSQESVREVSTGKVSIAEASLSPPQPEEAKANVSDPVGDNLTEAENYALYMTLAPLATASEFDENETLSMMYADVGSVPSARNDEKGVAVEVESVEKK